MRRLSAKRNQATDDLAGVAEGASRRGILISAVAVGSGAVMAALPARAMADPMLGAVGPDGESGIKLGDGPWVLYERENMGVVVEHGVMTLRVEHSPIVAPELRFRGVNGHWMIGGDVANHGGGARDFVLASRWNDDDTAVEDIVYLTPSGGGTRVGVGLTPPPLPYRLQAGGQGAEGGIGIVVPEQGEGHALGIVDSAGNHRVWIDREFLMHGLRAPEITLHSPEASYVVRVEGGQLVIRRNGDEVFRVPPVVTAADGELAELRERVARLERQLGRQRRRVRRLGRILRRRR